MSRLLVAGTAELRIVTVSTIKPSACNFFHFPLSFTVHRSIHGNVREVYRETRTKESVIPIVKKPYIVFKDSEREHVDAVAFQTLGYGNFKFIMHYQKYPQILTKKHKRK